MSVVSISEQGKVTSPLESLIQEHEQLNENLKNSWKKLLDETGKECSAMSEKVRQECIAMKEKSQKEQSDALSQFEAELAQKKAEKDEFLADWASEKSLIEKSKLFDDHIVTLNVGGKLFTTSISTLRSVSGSMLDVMFSGRHALKEDKHGHYFIDRDGKNFRHILNFLRDPTVWVLPPGNLFYTCDRGHTVDSYGHAAEITSNWCSICEAAEWQHMITENETAFCIELRAEAKFYGLEDAMFK